MYKVPVKLPPVVEIVLDYKSENGSENELNIASNTATNANADSIIRYIEMFSQKDKFLSTLGQAYP